MNKMEILNVYVKEANSKSRRYSECTTRTYLQFIDKYLDSLTKDLSDTTERDVRLFLSNYEDKSDSTYNLCLMALNSLYEILMVSPLVDEGYIINNPCSKIKGVAKPKKKEKKSLTEEDFNAMLDNCKNIRECAMLTMLRFTGIRSDEIRSITYNDYINYDANKGLTLKTTKGSKERTIFLNDRVVKEINAYLPYRKEKDNCECLFTSNTGTKILESSLYRTIKCIGKRANLDEDVLENLSPHSFRHTAISSWLNSGVPIQTVATIVGHSNVNMTFYYADKRMMNAKDAMMAM